MARTDLGALAALTLVALLAAACGGGGGAEPTATAGPPTAEFIDLSKSMTGRLP